jgi:hypothetical protein
VNVKNNPQDSFERVILSASVQLTEKEKFFLSQRFGILEDLWGKSAFDAFYETDASNRERIINIALKKCIHDPIDRLFKESEQRVKWFVRYGDEEPEGRDDLVLACRLLEKADALNDCRIYFDIPIPRKG